MFVQRSEFIPGWRIALDKNYKFLLNKLHQRYILCGMKARRPKNNYIFLAHGTCNVGWQVQQSWPGIDVMNGNFHFSTGTQVSGVLSTDC